MALSEVLLQQTIYYLFFYFSVACFVELYRKYVLCIGMCSSVFTFRRTIEMLRAVVRNCRKSCKSERCCFHFPDDGRVMNIVRA